MMNTEKLSCQAVAEIDAICAAYDNQEGELINILKDTQDRLGYLPLEAQHVIAEHLHVPAQRVYGVVTFYAFFTMEPKGKYPISVCMGTACFVKGADKVVHAFKEQLKIDIGDVTPDGKFSIDTLRCVGGCALAPIVMVGEKVYGNVTPGQVKKILADF